jgi:ribosomal protein L29
MALLRFKDIQKLSDKEVKDKLKELRLELVKSNVTANKSNAKVREIKRAVSRILTHLNKSSGGAKK